jgi:hypothetical protein
MGLVPATFYGSLGKRRLSIKETGWLDSRRAFRPVPGLGVFHMQFPMACAMGYFLSPSGLDSVKSQRSVRRENAP